MADERIKAVLIGAGSFGGAMLQALCDSPAVRVVGVSDQDPAAAQASAAKANCPAYDDHRRLLAQTRPAAVFMAVPPKAVAELVPLAVEYRVHVWAGAPFARGLPEAVALCRLTEQAGLKLAIGRMRRFAPGYRTARQWLARLGRLHLIRGHYLYNSGPTLGWHADRAAGGGALRELGGHLFDLAVWSAGLPEAVYCLAGAGKRPAGVAGQPLYDSDDSATCLLRYGQGCAGSFTVSRCFSPVSEGLELYGEGGSIHAAGERCLLRDREGAVLESLVDDQPPSAVFARQVESFARAAAGAIAFECSAWENLLTTAIVDTALLSVRTGQPESPHDLLRRYAVTQDDCLKFAIR